MDATLLLCDHAEAVNGKLYINGGGWNLLLRPGAPVSIALALLVEVPWDLADQPHELRAELLTVDGDPVEMDGAPVQLAATFHTGRPPGVKPGSPINVPLALNLQGLRLDLGGYEWRLFVDGEPVERKPFQVIEPPARL
jgi:hypothetical protein